MAEKMVAECVKHFVSLEASGVAWLLLLYATIAHAQKLHPAEATDDVKTPVAGFVRNLPQGTQQTFKPFESF